MILLCSDDRERAVAMRSEISSLLLLGGVYETMSITVAMRESRRKKGRLYARGRRIYSTI